MTVRLARSNRAQQTVFVTTIPIKQKERKPFWARLSRLLGECFSRASDNNAIKSLMKGKVSRKNISNSLVDA